MIITRNIIELGDSKAITLPKEISDDLKIKDKVVFDIKVVQNLSSDANIKDYECLVCNYRFSVNPYVDEIYCPSCQNENADAIKEVQVCVDENNIK
jgi:hypothetical protein